MYKTERIVELLNKHLKGTLGSQEFEELQRWTNAKPENQQLLAKLEQSDSLRTDIRLYWDLWNDNEAVEREERILDKVAQKTSTKRPYSFNILRKWLPYAAAILLIFSFIIYLGNKQPKQIEETTIAASNILPGGNRATLTLEDGRTIDLSSGQSGIIVGNGITYLDGSSIADKKSTSSETLVLKTPIGGNYQVILPDGSKAWLNADSKLTYPSHFATTERIVHLEGEAYFEVQHQILNRKKVPFKVVSNGQEVNVLGTAFNISAYAEESQIKTTLVNGAVEIVNLTSNSIKKIVPGQQAVLQGSDTKVNKVDVLKSIAWKHGQFSFDDKSFDQIMREMARWYNFKVKYEGAIPSDSFTGNAFKTDKLGTVLRFLETSDIKYHVNLKPNNTYQLTINNSDRKEATY